ncbi:MAG: putative Ig domain-containing protein [Thermoplasmata archaeon]
MRDVSRTRARVALLTAALYLGVLLTQPLASANLPPSISSVPHSEAFATFEYIYQVHASDPDGDFLSYSLADFPEGMVIDFLTGTVRWRPSLNQTGEHTVRLLVSDGTYSVVQEFILHVVLAANHPLPELRISAPREGQILNRTFYVRGVAWSAPDAPPVATVEVSIDSGPWFPASLQGEAWAFPLDTSKYRNGRHVLAARAFDGSAYSLELRVNLTFNNPRYVLMDYDVETERGPAPLAVVLAAVLVTGLVVIIIDWRRQRVVGGGDA